MMDEFQFIESLDALLANEAMDETTTAAVELANTIATSPLHMLGQLRSREQAAPGLSSRYRLCGRYSSPRALLRSSVFCELLSLGPSVLIGWA